MLLGMYQQESKSRIALESNSNQQASQSEKANGSSVCTLTYYYIRGLCQPIRNLLYFLNVQFVDRRLDKNSIQTLQLDKLQSTFNSGLPSFKDGELSISDCVGISIYICRKYSANFLTGKDIKMKAKINEALFKYWMEKKKIMPEIAEIIKKTAGYHEYEKGVLIRELVNKLATQTRFINFCLKGHKHTGGWVLGELTLIDFYFYETCFYVCGFFQSYIEADEDLKYFIDFCHKFEGLDFHRKVDARKTKLFLPFKNEVVREIVLSAWQGDEQQELD